ncbi:sensor histidine kinase [Mongoliimonas terrestris]|uniref:sensor histidine kinase n=1 Tax=Mongoliimonas terrestris TaxID=1709001 RepID=UPI00094952B7|nr:HAMP domain-containing sensor histidine kinase [Mongoliimonas terrestris]
MPSPGRLFRTTAFKLALVYLVVFSGLTLFLIAYISRSTTDLLTRQLESSIATEISSLVEQYRRGGIRQVVGSVEIRSRRPSASLYLVADFSGRTIVGNVADLPLAVLNLPDGKPVQVSYQRLDGDVAREFQALVRVFALPGGFRLLVGRDVGERTEFEDVIAESIQFVILVMVVMGLVTWVFVSRSVLGRVEDMAETSRRIISGDLGRRLQVTGSGDEFDNLATSLNHMLERIEALMTGLKEVSDDIAHDLKTPLTRLRNRLETALRDSRGEAGYREAIGASIEDADELIHLFDALLRIARVEAGSSGDELKPLDAAAIAADVAELYEPVVEDAGGTLTARVDGPLPIAGNRALISQALTNLLDNAIKYALPPEEGAPALSGTVAPALAGTVELRAKRVGEEVHLTVVDHGPGIPLADHERVTQRFVRLERSRTLPGSGLGLSLVSAVARLHGGRLALADAGPGLAATLVLPVRLETGGAEENHGTDVH